MQSRKNYYLLHNNAKLINTVSDKNADFLNETGVQHG